MTENTTTVTETVDAPATETKKAKDFTAYATKAPTNLHSHYAGWISDKTGLQFEGVDSADVTKIVQLAVTLYHDYQASDENKARKAAEASSKAPKVPSKTAQQLADQAAKIEQLKAQLAAAQATPAAKAPVRKTAAKATPVAK